MGTERSVSERGFQQYGGVRCSYGTEVRVVESSAVEPHVWLFAKEDPEILTSGEGASSAHLTPADARRLAALLTEAADAADPPAAAPEAPLEGPEHVQFAQEIAAFNAGWRAGQRGTDRLRDALDVALLLLRAVTEVEHLDASTEWMAEVSDLEDRSAALVVADSPRTDPATFSTNGGAYVDASQEPSAGGEA